MGGSSSRTSSSARGEPGLIQRFPVAAMIVAAGFFGLAATGTKYALGGFGPVTVLTVELLAATTGLWLLLLRRGYRRPRSLGRVAVLGICEPGLAYLFFSFGLDRTTAANGALLSSLESGFVVVLALLVLRERARWPVITAVLIAVAGTVVLEGSTTFTGPGLGDLLIGLGALCAAAYTIVARGLRTDEDSLTTTAHQFAVGLLLVLPLAVVRWSTGAEPPGIHVPLRFWLVAAGVGLLGFGASFLLYNAAIAHLAAGPAGVIINLAPAFGLISASLWLGEEMTDERLIGAALIALSVALFVSTEHHRPTARSAPTMIPAQRTADGGPGPAPIQHPSPPAVVSGPTDAL